MTVRGQVARGLGRAYFGAWFKRADGSCHCPLPSRAQQYTDPVLLAPWAARGGLNRNAAVMMFNPVAAFIWLAVGLLLVLGSRWSPDIHRLVLLFRINPGWVALGLAAYNVLRWASLRMLQNTRRAEQVAGTQLQVRTRPSAPRTGRDPTFDFSERPAPAEPESPNPKPDTNV